MAKEEKTDVGKKGISRREFLRDAGLVMGSVGAAAVINTYTAATVSAAQTGIANKTVTVPPLVLPVSPVTVGPSVKKITNLKINGRQYQVQVDNNWTLQRTLQFVLGLTGCAKTMCDRGVCGSCTVIMDGKAVLSCTALTVECEGRNIETIEGIAAANHPLIEAYANNDALQCGYCTPGFVTAAKALLDSKNNPTESDIKEALAGQICCCGTYPRHILAILEAAQILRGGV